MLFLYKKLTISKQNNICQTKDILLNIHYMKSHELQNAIMKAQLFKELTNWLFKDNKFSATLNDYYSIKSKIYKPTSQADK